MKHLVKIITLFLLPLSIYSATLDVTSGPTSGLTTINITVDGGEIFGIPATVTIGGIDATVETSASGVIVIKTPEGVGQNLVVEIMSSTGTIIANSQFSYESPLMTSISPEEYFARGGEIATVMGSNFGTETVGPADVIVGGNAAQIISQDHSLITFRMPGGTGANKNVRLRVGGQLSNILQVDYRPPSIWKIEPQEVSADAGDTIYICGVNFGNGYDLPVVSMGGIACQEVVYAGDDKLYAVIGFGIPQNLDIEVELGGQISDPYTLRNKQPEIVNVLDALWEPVGGENITLFAKYAGHDINIITIALNGHPIPLNSLIGNTITFTSISGVGQDLSLVLTVNGVASEPYPIHYEQSVLTDISPTSGNTIGGLPITISGPGIGAGPVLPEVLFGNNLASNVQVVNDNQLSCLLPAGVGQVEVHLELNGVTSNSIPFTYNAPQIFAVNPTIISLSGGETTIAGIDLGNTIDDVVVIADGQELIPTAVNFGAVTLNLPAGFGQGKDIQLRVGGILSNILTYGYVPPSITSITPSSGLPGEVLHILGSNLGGRTIPSMVTIDGNQAGILTSSNNEIRCIVPMGIGENKEVAVSIGNATDTFTGFTYDDPPIIQDQKVEVVGQLRITDLPFKSSNGVLLGVDSQGNLVRNTSPQIFVSLANDTLFLGSDQFLIIPGISKANGGN